ARAPVEVGMQCLCRIRAGIVCARMRAQPVGEHAVIVRGRVQLGAVAGRQQRHLAHARQRPQFRQGGRNRAVGERDALAQGDRCGLVVDAEGVQGHCALAGGPPGVCRSGACDKLRGRQDIHFKARPTSMPVFPNFARRITLSCLLALPMASAGAVDAPLREDVLGATMAGEFALQAGRLDEAAAWYLDAARAAGGGEAGLAERATRIALPGKDDRLGARALALWSERAPGSLPMHAAEAPLALRQGRERAALRKLRALIADPDPAGWRHSLSVIATGPRDPEVSGRIMRRLFDAGAVPDQLQAWLAFGDLAQRLEQGELARDVVARIVERFPGEPRIALLRASLLRESGDLEGARDALAGARD